MLPERDKWCMEFGAWDGQFLSNTCNLIENGDYSAVMIEYSRVRFLDLLQATASRTVRGRKKVIRQPELFPGDLRQFLLQLLTERAFLSLRDQLVESREARARIFNQARLDFLLGRHTENHIVDHLHIGLM
jgi:hypothetical protein